MAIIKKIGIGAAVFGFALTLAVTSADAQRRHWVGDGCGHARARSYEHKIDRGSRRVVTYRSSPRYTTTYRSSPRYSTRYYNQSYRTYPRYRNSQRYYTNYYPSYRSYRSYPRYRRRSGLSVSVGFGIGF